MAFLVIWLVFVQISSISSVKVRQKERQNPAPPLHKRIGCVWSLEQIGSDQIWGLERPVTKHSICLTWYSAHRLDLVETGQAKGQTHWTSITSFFFSCEEIVSSFQKNTNIWGAISAVMATLWCLVILSVYHKLTIMTSTITTTWQHFTRQFFLFT